jgi:hypothetical protein
MKSSFSFELKTLETHHCLPRLASPKRLAEKPYILLLSRRNSESDVQMKKSKIAIVITIFAIIGVFVYCLPSISLCLYLNTLPPQPQGDIIIDGHITLNGGTLGAIFFVNNNTGLNYNSSVDGLGNYNIEVVPNHQEYNVYIIYHESCSGNFECSWYQIDAGAVDIEQNASQNSFIWNWEGSAPSSPSNAQW